MTPIPAELDARIKKVVESAQFGPAQLESGIRAIVADALKFHRQDDCDRISQLQQSLAYAEQQIEDVRRPSARTTMEQTQEAVRR